MTSAFGRWVAAGATAAGRLTGWAVRPDDLDATAVRLGLRIDAGSRTKPSGERIEWRSAGVDVVTSRPWLPFFIEWSTVSAFPGRTPEPAAAITQLEVEADERELADWLGDHALPLQVRDGERGLARVVLEATTGRVVLANGA